MLNWTRTPLRWSTVSPTVPRQSVLTISVIVSTLSLVETFSTVSGPEDAISPNHDPSTVSSPPPSTAPVPSTSIPPRADITPVPSPSEASPSSSSSMADDTDAPSAEPPTETPPSPTPSPTPSPAPSSTPSSIPTPSLTPTPTLAPTPTPKTPDPSPPATTSPAPTATPKASPSPSSLSPPSTSAPPPPTQGGTQDASKESNTASPTLVPENTPETIAPATSSPSPVTSTPSSEPTVTSYNSTTLPPDLDSNVLDGGQLVNVETTAVTQNGQTSISYTIVVKKGDRIEIVRRPGSNSTKVADSQVGVPSSSPLVDPSSGADALVGPESNPGGLSRGVIIGLLVGALVLVLMVSAFVTGRIAKRRRRKKQNGLAGDLPAPPNCRNARTLEDRYSALETIRTDYRDATTHTNTHPSSLQGSPRHQSSSLWEDRTIVAARIPFDKVQVGTLLSRGGYGEVYRGVYRDQAVAIKKLLPETRKDLNHIESFLSEIKLAATLEHPRIVAFIGVAWESLSELYSVSEFMDGGDLRALLVRYNQPGSSTGQGFNRAKVKIALHVAHALTYLHSLQPQILHRDLKSRNILLTEKLDAKLTDFGSSRSKKSDDRTMTAGVGSSLWMAPEVMIGKRYGDKSDIFSLGIVLSELDTHGLPYAHIKESGKSDSNRGNSGSGPRSFPDTAILQMVSMGKLQVQFSKHCHQEMARLAQKCISVDPHERPTAAEVLYQLHVVLRTFEESTERLETQH